MISPRTGVVTLLLTLTVLAAGCGGDGNDGDVSPAPGAEGAEQRVREFMTAEYGGEADTACGYITEELAAKLTTEVASCELLVQSQKALVDTGQAKFEDEPISADKVADLELETRLGDGDTTATVTGPKGEQSFELEVIDEEWTITGIPGTTT